MMKKIVAILLIALMSVSVIGAERITEEVEIRGTVVTGNFDYDYSSFAGFWYDIDKDLTSEMLNVTVSGRDATVTYQCDPKIQAHENILLGDYTIIGLFADKYVCYDNNTDELVKLLIEEDGSDDHNVEMGELITLPENFAVAITQIDLNGDKAVLVLYKDGIALDTEVCASGDTYIYEDDNDVMIFSCVLDQVFRGTDTNMCTLNYMWLISDDVLEIDTNDSFGEMEVTSTSNGITMKSDGTIGLTQDDEVVLMGDLYFKVADSATLRYYLAKTVVLECEECPAVIEPAPCPDCPEPEPCPEVTPEVIVNETVVYVDAPVEPVEDKTLPGMEAVFAIAGLLMVAYVIMKQKD